MAGVAARADAARRGRRDARSRHLLVQLHEERPRRTLAFARLATATAADRRTALGRRPAADRRGRCRRVLLLLRRGARERERVARLLAIEGEVALVAARRARVAQQLPPYLLLARAEEQPVEAHQRVRHRPLALGLGQVHPREQPVLLARLRGNPSLKTGHGIAAARAAEDGAVELEQPLRLRERSRGRL